MTSILARKSRYLVNQAAPLEGKVFYRFRLLLTCFAWLGWVMKNGLAACFAAIFQFAKIKTKFLAQRQPKSHRRKISYKKGYSFNEYKSMIQKLKKVKHSSFIEEVVVNGLSKPRFMHYMLCILPQIPFSKLET